MEHFALEYGPWGRDTGADGREWYKSSEAFRRQIQLTLPYAKHCASTKTHPEKSPLL